MFTATSGAPARYFLAAAGLAQQQHRHIGLRSGADLLAHHDGGAAHAQQPGHRIVARQRGGPVQAQQHGAAQAQHGAFGHALGPQVLYGAHFLAV
jgi:hypothetical protein